ncbi:hypothetical protein V6N13_140515 [Hibiscus sabdariffa]|uniref:Uncharacterized protein n=2 Tax=Hibiscus sabdariffa TaxID=183260 RepID=A0ABR2Q2M5_9ROSI
MAKVQLSSLFYRIHSQQYIKVCLSVRSRGQATTTRDLPIVAFAAAAAAALSTSHSIFLDAKGKAFLPTYSILHGIKGAGEL